ncbi:hypothetical protein AJ80_08776 [Polytolypa hystricis UAMH7299]|uniref:Exonuclease domain-containing protein n=1 Tax=Polytolypa hystricis (strain UAMH7299) TaxID=1447883 RepID=A0A2B7X2G2_POLH7|nr:hypothetical protein AJ80_08776 [Polytolypa hystricis UAMH7299]
MTMFTPLGLFVGVPCPEDDHCSLMNCIFQHTSKECAPTALRPLTPVIPPETLATDAEEPLRKRRRIDEAVDGSPSQAEVAVNKAEQRDQKNESSKEPTPNTDMKPSPKDMQNLRSVSNTVSPPRVKRSLSIPTSETKSKAPQQPAAPAAATPAPVAPKAPRAMTTPIRRQVKKESLNPRHLSKPPAAHAVRTAILVKLHEAMVSLNTQVAKSIDKSKKKALMLSPDELISMALDEEEKVAKENPSIYSNIVKLRITKLRKMTMPDWEKNVVAFLKLTPTTSQSQKTNNEVISTGLEPNEEIAVLTKFFASPENLAKAEFITSVPPDERVSAARSGAETAQGWEQCDRCKGRFQVFPGRREDGLLATGGPCTYHHAKPMLPQRQRTDHITGHKEAYYPCCNETVGTSSGCTKASWHVFKLSDPNRLAAIMQFQETPRQPGKGAKLPPVCFDCEMGYTTLGLELIRLTAVSWPQGKTLIDVLVRPIGEVLDFNTRYSGVHPEQFAKAIPYSTKANNKSKPTPADQASNTSSSQSQPPLQVVDSPTAARTLLFDHLQPETPLIGHAINNDLNACRIIHPTIVDTVFLYPHPRGLPIRFALRTLAKRFLDRAIQATGGSQGHDSMEDARATGDLVRVKVRETWKGLQRLGWRIKGGELVAPVDASSMGWQRQQGNIGVVGSGVLGYGAGVKRKDTG